MTIISNVDLGPLAEGLSFDVSINVPDFREVQFLFVQQEDWWMLSIDSRPAFRIATFTNYNLRDFIDSDLEFTFQLKPKNMLSQELTIDNIGDFYLRFRSGDGFDERPVKTVSPDFIYSDAIQPFDDFLLKPLPAGGSQFAYLTSSNIKHGNLDITGWANLIGDDWDDILNTEISINGEFNINSAQVQADTIIRRASTIGQNLESAPTVIAVFKPEFLATGVEYNLVQLGTDNDAYITIKRIDIDTIEYKIYRGIASTLQVDYVEGDVVAAVFQVDKSEATFIGGQSIFASTGDSITGANNTVFDVGGYWGIMPNAGRDLVKMQLIELQLLQPFRTIDQLNTYFIYLNKKYGFNFALIP